jgi:hypothetical protein
MVNKRRRSTIIVLATVFLIVLSQLPNLVNILQPWNKRQPDELTAQMKNELEELRRVFASGKITLAEFNRRQQEIQERHQAREQGPSP